MSKIHVVPVLDVKMIRNQEIEIKNPYINTSEDAKHALSPLFELNKCQSVYALALSRRRALIAILPIYEGPLQNFRTPPAEIFQKAVLINASYLVVAHHRPDENELISLTEQFQMRRLVLAGQAIDIPIVEYIVVNQDSYTSVLEEKKNFEKFMNP